MENDDAILSDSDSTKTLSPAPEPPRLHNVNAMKLWLDLNEILQEYDLEGVTDLSELNTRLDWKDVRTLQKLNIKQCMERRRVREQVGHARNSLEAECDPDVGKSFRPLWYVTMIGSVGE
jgi:hypothetical protein